MNINSHIDSIITSLSQAHVIELNDDMLLLKFHNNQAIKQLLQREQIKIKRIHFNENTSIEGKPEDRTGDILEPTYITVGIIKNTLKNHSIDFSCCEIDMKRLNNNIFSKIESSGILINGAFSLLDTHLDNPDHPREKYGIIDKDKIYHSVGYYSHTLDNNGHQLPIIPYDDSTLEPLEPLDNSMTGITMDWIKDTIGILVVSDRQRIDIIPFDKFDYSAKKNIDQYLTGNLLVYDHNILFDDSLVTRCITVRQIGYIPKFTQCVLCDAGGRQLTSDELADYGYLETIYIKPISPTIEQSGLGPIEGQYSSSNIFTPYSNHLITLESGALADMIPPAMPMHASDLDQRSCIMIDDNNNIFVIHVEGHYKVCEGVGIDLFDLAKLCKSLGAKHAINLDGGNSSRMIFKEMNNMASFAGFDPADFDYDNFGDDPIGNSILITKL